MKQRPARDSEREDPRPGGPDAVCRNRRWRWRPLRLLDAPALAIVRTLALEACRVSDDDWGGSALPEGPLPALRASRAV
jgi:hypothetical protein